MIKSQKCPVDERMRIPKWLVSHLLMVVVFSEAVDADPSPVEVTPAKSLSPGYGKYLKFNCCTACLRHLRTALPESGRLAAGPYRLNSPFTELRT